jgi:hypothetical protein
VGERVNGACGIMGDVACGSDEGGGVAIERAGEQMRNKKNYKYFKLNKIKNLN